MIIESTKQVSLSDSHSFLKAPGEGDFTVLQDRKVVGELVKEFVQQKLWEALNKKDFCKYRFLLNQQVVLLRNSNTEAHPGFLPADVGSNLESASNLQVVQKFLAENGFEKVVQRDRAGWSPLLYAALTGNEKLVEALLVHRADPNDSIHKVQKSIIYVKGTPAVSLGIFCGMVEKIRETTTVWMYIWSVNNGIFYDILLYQLVIAGFLKHQLYDLHFLKVAFYCQPESH